MRCNVPKSMWSDWESLEFPKINLKTALTDRIEKSIVWKFSIPVKIGKHGESSTNYADTLKILEIKTLESKVFS